MCVNASRFSCRSCRKSANSGASDIQSKGHQGRCNRPETVFTVYRFSFIDRRPKQTSWQFRQTLPIMRIGGSAQCSAHAKTATAVASTNFVDTCRPTGTIPVPLPFLLPCGLNRVAALAGGFWQTPLQIHSIDAPVVLVPVACAPERTTLSRLAALFPGLRALDSSREFQQLPRSQQNTTLHRLRTPSGYLLRFRRSLCLP